MPIPGNFRLAARPSASGSNAPKADTSKQPHVLVVDDVKAIIEIVRDVLLNDGFTVEATTNATEALGWLTDRPSAFDALVSDLDMPSMSGTALIARARKQGFQGKTIIHSGSVPEEIDENLEQFADAVVEKPFATRNLAPTLRRLLA